METIEVVLDEKIKNNSLFTNKKTIQINYEDIIKYGIYNVDIPLFIHETDFFYLQKQIPAYESILSSNLDVKSSRIINNATGEMKTKVSEYIGVGVGIKYFVELLGIHESSISKIPKPLNRKKYLDFISKSKKGQFELECKGTINESKKNSILYDINGKKGDSDSGNTQIGTITFARVHDDYRESYIYVTDDYIDSPKGYAIASSDVFLHYSLFLSMILNNTYYNRAYRNFTQKKKPKKNSIPKSKFFTSITIDGVKYFGDFFDRRLAVEPVEIKKMTKNTTETVLKKLTSVYGIYKYFIGIDERVIDALNNLDALYFNMEGSVVHDNLKGSKGDEDFVIKSNDGTIMIRESNQKRSIIEHYFSEEEVKRRLNFYIRYVHNQPHKCGAPCTSREIEGKPCEISTYREYCHFHR